MTDTEKAKVFLIEQIRRHAKAGAVMPIREDLGRAIGVSRDIITLALGKLAAEGKIRMQSKSSRNRRFGMCIGGKMKWTKWPEEDTLTRLKWQIANYHNKPCPTNRELAKPFGMTEQGMATMIRRAIKAGHLLVDHSESQMVRRLAAKSAGEWYWTDWTSREGERPVTTLSTEERDRRFAELIAATEEGGYHDHPVEAARSRKASFPRIDRPPTHVITQSSAA